MDANRKNGPATIGFTISNHLGTIINLFTTSIEIVEAMAFKFVIDHALLTKRYI